MAAILGATGCASEDKALRRDLEAMRDEMQTIRRENAQLAKQVEALSARVDLLASRAAPRTRAPEAAAASAPVVPPDLAVVRVQPPAPPARADSHRTSRSHAARAPRTPPPLPTAVPVADPDVAELRSLGAPAGDLAAEARASLDAARHLSGLEGARALEAFAERYPRHPSADNALLEAATARSAAGDADGACALLARCAEEYPAGDAFPDALEGVGECDERRGDVAAARARFARVAADYPDSPASQRARGRLAANPGSPPARQGAVP